jgi:hypothetical protein
MSVQILDEGGYFKLRIGGILYGFFRSIGEAQEFTRSKECAETREWSEALRLARQTEEPA